MTSRLELFGEVKRIVDRIPVDVIGGCPLPKSFVTACLALEQGLKNYVEIGVYRGRSLFPAAHVARALGGMAYGIDPYDKEAAQQQDLEPAVRRRVDAFFDSLDFAGVYSQVLELRDELGLAAATTIIREPSAVAAAMLARQHLAIDLLHIDGNHDARCVNQDIELFLPLVRDGGFIILDDIDWASVEPAFNRLKKRLDVVFDNGQFAILAKAARGTGLSMLDRHRLRILHELADDSRPVHSPSAPTVSVVVLAYNQEKYVAECMEGILAQRGSPIELVIGDDCSTDSTMAIIDRYLEQFAGPDIAIKRLPRDTNLGVSHNLKRCFDACTGEYIAICEGDDYWIDPRKLHLQVDLLQQHPEFSMCFHNIELLFQDSGESAPFELQLEVNAPSYTTSDIIHDYVVGNISCCMYDARRLRQLPPGLFNLFIGDWMLNICCSRLGDVGHLEPVMSVYRKHQEGVWSGYSSRHQTQALHGYIDEYNRFLDYEFDAEFSLQQQRMAAGFSETFYQEPLDLAIIDDVFPHPLSAFRVQEFESYLQAFERIRIYATGQNVHLLGKETLQELLTTFKHSHPEDAGRVERLTDFSTVNARLIYLVFLGNAYEHIHWIEQAGTPFAFTLYPGGGFAIDDAISDTLLRRVTASPCFRTVIVTQQMTYDYLIDKGFCRPEQIKFIFGLVTPFEQVTGEHSGKRRFGVDKAHLDVCFVAHKYSARGEDKGYDLFIDAARELCRRHDDIRCHVVGGFSQHDIDVSDFSERITFHGSRSMDWFDEFYRDIDLILAPNRPSILGKGAFDGFPTGASVDAGLRGVAIVAADPLGLNTHFVDGEDIVIVPLEASAIVTTIERYYSDPVQLRMVAEAGTRTVKRLYGYEAQMRPRIALLKALSAAAAVPAKVPGRFRDIRADVNAPRQVRDNYHAFNIVRWAGHLWGLPHALGPVDLATADPAKLIAAGAMVDGLQQGLERRIRLSRPPGERSNTDTRGTRPPAVPHPEREGHRGFNIVSYAGRFFALPQSLGRVDLMTADAETLKKTGAFIEDSFDAVLRRVDRRGR